MDWFLIIIIGMPTLLVLVSTASIIVDLFTIVRCPYCGRKVSTSGLGIFSAKTFRCACGTRVVVSPGLRRKRLIDWETPD